VVADSRRQTASQINRSSQSSESIAVDLSQAILGLDEDRFGGGGCEATFADPFGTVDQDSWWQVGFPTLHLL
jgi:hypothetical protein